jgi:hypothetical protein
MVRLLPVTATPLICFWATVAPFFAVAVTVH